MFLYAKLGGVGIDVLINTQQIAYVKPCADEKAACWATVVGETEQWNLPMSAQDFKKLVNEPPDRTQR